MSGPDTHDVLIMADASGGSEPRQSAPLSVAVRVRPPAKSEDAVAFEASEAAVFETSKGAVQQEFGFERAARRAQYLVSAEIHGFPSDHLERLPAEFAAVTVEDVLRAAGAHLHPDAGAIAVSGPPVAL